MVDMTQLESAIWRIADGRGNDDDVALLRDGGATSLSLLARLIGEAEDGLASARDLPGDEREHVVADFTDTVRSLRRTADLLRPARAAEAERPPDEVVLQASWSAGTIVVWAGGRGAMPASNDELATRLEMCGGPSQGWSVHPGIRVGGRRLGRGLVDPGEGRAGMADRDQRRSGRERSRTQRALAGTGGPGGCSGGGPRRDRAAPRGGLAGERSIRRRAGAMGSGVVGFGDDRLVGVGDAGHGRRAVRRSCRGHDSWSHRRSGRSDRVRGSRTT